MIWTGKAKKPFSDIEEAAKSFPRSGGPNRLLVLNRQGLPVLQYDNKHGTSVEIDERYAAKGADLVRETQRLAVDMEGESPHRIAFFFADHVVTVEQDDPFIYIIEWAKNALKIPGSLEGNYFKRLVQVIHEELT